MQLNFGLLGHGPGAGGGWLLNRRTVSTIDVGHALFLLIGHKASVAHAQETQRLVRLQRYEIVLSLALAQLSLLWIVTIPIHIRGTLTLRL